MGSDDLAVVKTNVLAIRDDLKEIKERLAGMEGRLRQLELNNVAVKVRMGIFSTLAASIGVLAAAIAAWLGTR